MTDSQFETALVARINLQLDLPYFTEPQEAAMISWLVGKVAGYIPQSVKAFILDAADGIDADELGRLEDVLVSVLNRYIDIPWVPESIEEQLLRPVVQACLDLAKDGMSLTEVD